MQNLLTQIVKQAQQPDNLLPPQVRSAKLMEEVGEFAETVLVSHGYLAHKRVKERPEGEAADVVICVLDTLAGVYPQLSPERIIELLTEQIIKKRAKWTDVTLKSGLTDIKLKSGDPCPGCKPGTVCRTPYCKRLRDEFKGKY